MQGGNLAIVVPAGLEPRQRAPVGQGEPPYWADVWPASVALARWLCRRGGLQGRSVVDLGCGLGVVGAAAARCGARVTLADREPDALAFASFNARLQGGAAAVEAVHHDWHRATLAAAFDLVCLADVSYRPVHHRPLLRHLEQCLRRGGLCIHADPERRESDGFLRLLAPRFATRSELVSTHFDGARRTVRLCFASHSQQDLDRWWPARVGTRDSRGAAPATTASR
jgi:2-polyprenyl-3-methyl-5-hydroxy-6-metoxy-1,4-benzoquinol methylase